MLLTLMCVSHSRGATYQINGAREVQGERKSNLLAFAEPQPSLAVHFPLNALQRYKLKRYPPNVFWTLFYL